jgi:hypothetical protein
VKAFAAAVDLEEERVASAETKRLIGALLNVLAERRLADETVDLPSPAKSAA